MCSGKFAFVSTQFRLNRHYQGDNPQFSIFYSNHLERRYKVRLGFCTFSLRVYLGYGRMYSQTASGNLRCRQSRQDLELQGLHG